ncbi:MAG TPA: HAMP domain-containing sensor histidine kinase [Micromonosporaceae bacterium]
MLVTCGAALISVLVTAAVAFPLAVRAANRQARDALAVETKVVTEVLRPRLATGDTAAEDRAVRTLRGQGIDVYLIHHGTPDRVGLPARVVRQIGAGKPVSERPAVVAGRVSLVEGRPLPGGDGVVLVQPLVTGTARQVARVLWLPLLAGLLGGAAAGAFLASRIAQPLRHAATAAARLSAGDRTVRVPVQPPAEVEDLSRALNQLAAALATSENRQREFLLSISHELRTPLTTLRGYAEAIADGVIAPQDAGQAGRTMLAEAEHLDRLVADLLALARLEADEFPLELLPVDLTALVAGVAEAWRGRVESAGLVLRTELPPGPVAVLTDPGRIRQVIDGLLENALRVVPAGAPVVLAVRDADPPGYGVVEVRDGGPGFTDEDLAVAFERGALYQRYRGVRKVGSGLGLALAARLVRRLGGAIEAGHATEGGARFTVRLPYPGSYQPRTSP